METNAVTFGRMNLPHPGHVHLIKLMLKEADHAFVGLSLAKRNNNVELRRDVLQALLENEGVDTKRVSLFGSAGPYQAVEYCITDATTVVLGVDQTVLGERLRDDLGVKFVPNKIRVGSSTVIRYFLEIGEEQIVREIYHNDENLFNKIITLYKEELAK
jgi:hypothetical protein